MSVNVRQRRAGAADRARAGTDRSSGAQRSAMAETLPLLESTGGFGEITHTGDRREPFGQPSEWRRSKRVLDKAAFASARAHE
jgi:hypothetical protein